MSGHLSEWRRDTGPGNIQPMMLVACKFRVSQPPTFSSRLVNECKIDLVIVFIFKDPFSSRLSHGKKVVNAYFSSTKLTPLQTAYRLPASSLNSSCIIWRCALGHCPVVGGNLLQSSAVHRIWH